jgi:hypothetical protein
MTADPLPRADRARKARRSSVVACGHYVLVGQVIVRRGGRWTCLPCALDAIKTPAGSTHAAASPTEERGHNAVGRGLS